MNFFSSPDGARLAFLDEGDGTPILCLSGLTRNSSDFDYVAPHLSDCRLIRLDYRGRGKSDWTGATTYTIPTETTDAIALLDHLGLDQAAVLGTSRGGLIAMTLAATAKNRLSGACLVDIGPELDPKGLAVIGGYVGRRPAQTTYEEAAKARADFMTTFRNVPSERWDEEVRKHFVQVPGGLDINYDPDLRISVETAGTQPVPDLWPFFDALNDLPLAAIRGANSDLLASTTLHKMRRRRPDMLWADVADRGHVPFLDEPEALQTLRDWISLLT